jgi:hypothetical protein
MSTAELLAMAHLALSAVFLLWNILLASRINRQRAVPHLLAALTALGGLLIAPALLILVASTSLTTGRSVSSIAWIWPVTATLIAAQAFYATATRLVSPVIGIPILLYDIVAAGTALGGYLVAQGTLTSGPLLTLVAASGSAVATVAGGASAMSPLHATIPLLSPAHPSRWPIIAGWRLAVAALAAAWVVLIVAGWANGKRAVEAYDRFASVELRVRPDEPFAVGLEILPPLGAPPLAAALRYDMELVGNGQLDAVLVTIARRGAGNLALDSIARALEPFRRDGLILIAGMAPVDAVTRTDRSSSADSASVAAVQRVARRLRPDYLIALDDPIGADVREDDDLEQRKLRIRAFAAAVKKVDPRIRVGISVVPGARDSSVHAWAASGDSPLDVVGFSILADAGGGPRLDARIRTADSWMRSVGTLKEHWIFRGGGAPSLHGDVAQERTIAGLLGWAMGRPGVRGLIVTHAGDYGSMRGLRAPSGRLRPGAATMFRAAREADSR